MKRVPALDLGVRPPVKPFAEWERRSEQLARDPEMRRLCRGVWVRSCDPPSVPQRAVLLNRHLRSPDNRLRVTGLTALELLNLPVGGTPPWVNRFLGHPFPPRATELRSALLVPHLAWHGTRTRTFRSDVRITKSYGLNRYYGPWGSWLAHPLEALVVAAPYLSQWRLISCLDALVSQQIVVDRTVALQVFTREELDRALALLPPHAAQVRRVAAALRQARGPTRSPAESLVRLMALHRGLPHPEPNHPVTVHGRVFYLDLAWPGAKVALEYNGEVHYLNRAQYEDENYRLQLLRDSGWDVRVLVWSDLKDPGRREAWLEFLAERLG